MNKSGLKKIWWLHPGIVYLSYMLIIIGAYNVDENKYYALYKMTKGITMEHVLLYFITGLFFLIGVISSRKIKFKSSIKTQFEKKCRNEDVLYKGFLVMFYISLVAYIIWFSNAILMHGDVIVSVLFNFSALGDYTQRFFLESGRFSGVTTFTELGTILSPLGCYIYFNANNVLIKNSVKRKLQILLFCNFLRALIFSERVALVSFCLPLFLVWLAYQKKFYKSLVSRFMPFIGMLVLFLLFGVFEYSRSWSWHYQYIYDSYIMFIYERIMGYYYCAINTECLVVENIGVLYFPYRTVSWLYRLPFVENFVNINFEQAILYEKLLNNLGNPEFNNPGGLLSIYLDYGVLGFFLYFLLGFLIGKTYYMYIECTALGIICYPYIYYALLELPRFYSLGNNHFFFFVMGIVMMFFLVFNWGGRQCHTY